MSKLPHHISTEDLLASLETAEDTETTEWSNDVPYFLSHFKFEQGQNKVKNNLIYRLYRLYSKKPVSQCEFSATVSQFIEYNGKYFKMNVKPMRIAKVVNTKVKDKKISIATNLVYKAKYEKFLKECDVKKGRTWVEGLILYEIYRHYAINNNFKSKLSQPCFILISKLYFKTKRIGESNAVWFNIDKEIVSRFLTEQDLINVNSRRKVVSQKTRSKISETLKRRKNVEKESKDVEEQLQVSSISTTS
jgi:hypothetical protein